MKFTVGQLVVKTTGGPAMTVVDDVELTCQWVQGGGYREQRFQEFELISLAEWIESQIVKKTRRRRRA